MPEQVNPVTPQQPTTTAAAPKNPINWKNVLPGMIIGVILVGIVAITFWYFTRPKESETSPVTTTKTSTSSAKPATPSAQKDETAGWKLYESKTFGYSFKYPAIYKIEGPGQQTHNQIEVNSPDFSYSETPDGRFITNGSNLNITVAAINNKGRAWRMPEHQENLRTIEVAGQAAKRFDYSTPSNGYFDLVLLDGNNRYYEFWFHATGKNKPEETKNFELLLSTFKFLD